MTVLDQHPSKNKPQQFDLFATNEAPAERTNDDAAPAVAMPAHDPLADLAVKLEHDRCKCGSDTAIIGASKAMHRASLSCRSCGRFRGWLPRSTADWIETVISLHGRPDDAIVIRGPRK